MKIDCTCWGGGLKLIGLALLLVVFPVSAQETNWYSAGIRGGIASSEPSFFQCEVFVNRDLRWLWALGPYFSLKPRLELTSGILTRFGQYGYVGTFGPGLVLRYRDLPISGNCGVRVTYLSQSAFGDRDFGTPFQFTSHCGLDWTVDARWDLGYRFQHMSNGGLGRTNPGLNLHMIGATYHF
jgi:hypothetical protein